MLRWRDKINRRHFIPAISTFIVSIFMGAKTFAQKVSRTYIVPSIETENKTLKEFEKAVREHINELSRRLEDGNL